MVGSSGSFPVNGGQCKPSIIGASRNPVGAIRRAGSKSYPERSASSSRRSTIRCQNFASLGSSKTQSVRRDCLGTGTLESMPAFVVGAVGVRGDMAAYTKAVNLSKSPSRTRLVKCSSKMNSWRLEAAFPNAGDVLSPLSGASSRASDWSSKTSGGSRTTAWSTVRVS